MDLSYICPHCGAKTAFAIFPVVDALDSQICIDLIPDPTTGVRVTKFRVAGFPSTPGGGPLVKYHPRRFVTSCLSCGEFSYWEDGKLAFPIRTGTLPSPDMPDNAAEVFREAQAIISLSPRAACALLRVCLEMIADWYGENQNVEGFDKSEKLYKKSIRSESLRPSNKLPRHAESRGTSTHTLAKLIFPAKILMKSPKQCPE